MMEIGCNIFSGSDWGLPTVSASLSGLTSNAEFGATAQIGTALTAAGVGGVATAYQWATVESGDLVGETAAQYTPAAGYDTERIFCKVTIAGQVYNSPLYTIRYAPAAISVAPTLAAAGTNLGDTITFSGGTWTNAAGGAFSRIWYVDGVAMPVQPGLTYDIAAGDSAGIIEAAQIYTNSGGTVVALTNAVAVDTFAAPSISGVPTISGTVNQGDTLTATKATVTGHPTPTAAYQWQRNDGTLGAWQNIAGATGLTRVLGAADVGFRLRVVQSETNAIGSDSATSAQSAIVQGVTVALPVVSASSYNATTKKISLSINADAGDCTIDWTAHNSGGTQVESGSFTSSAPTDADAITVTDTTISEIRFIATNAAGDTGVPSAGNNTIITGIVVYPAAAYSSGLPYPTATAGPQTATVDMEPGMNVAYFYVSGQILSAAPTIDANPMTLVGTRFDAEANQYIYCYSYFHAAPKKAGVTLSWTWTGSVFRTLYDLHHLGDVAYVAGSQMPASGTAQTIDVGMNASNGDLITAQFYIRSGPTSYTASTTGGVLTKNADRVVESPRNMVAASNMNVASATPLVATNDSGLGDANAHAGVAHLWRPN